MGGPSYKPSYKPATFFNKGPDSNYFKLFRLCSLSQPLNMALVVWELPKIIQNNKWCLFRLP